MKSLNGNESSDDEDQLYSECEISLSNISRNNPTIEEREGVQYEVR